MFKVNQSAYAIETKERAKNAAKNVSCTMESMIRRRLGLVKNVICEEIKFDEYNLINEVLM